jgi:hypothetical protein
VALVLVLALQDYDGPENDPDAGMQYFQKRFVRLTQKANKVLEKKVGPGGDREIPRLVIPRQVYPQ